MRRIVGDGIDVETLPRWQRWLFEHFESLDEWMKTGDGHSLRSALTLGIVYTILSLTIGLFVVKPFLMLLVLVWNMRWLDWRNGPNPLVWGEDGWPLKGDCYRTYPHSSRWMQNKYGDFYHPALKWYNPPIALITFLFAWGCGSGDVFHWNFLDTVKFIAPILIAGLVVVYVLAVIRALRRWLNKPRRPEPKFTRL